MAKSLRIKQRALLLGKRLRLDADQLSEQESDELMTKTQGRTFGGEFVVPKIEALAAKGLNNREIAKALGIGERTLYDWIRDDPQVSHTIKKYRGLADIEVENSLYKSALGFKIEETKIERVWNRDIRDYETVVTEIQERHIAPNTAAQIFYLKNRMANRYKDKVETEITLGAGIEQLAFAVKRRGE